MADTTNTLARDDELGFTTKVAAGIAPMNGLDVAVVRAQHVGCDDRDGKRLPVVLAEIEAKAENGGTAVTALTKRVDGVETRLTTAETTLAKKAEIDDSKAAADKAYSGAKVEDVVTTAKQAVKDELLGGAGDAFDTLKELADAITTNKDAITALQGIAGNHVRFDQAQTLTDAQKKQARDNVGAASAADLAAGLAKKLDGSVLKAAPAEGEKVPLGTLTTEGEFIVTSPNERPTNFNADPLLVSVRRNGSLIFQLVGGIDDGRYQLFGRTGTITPAEGETPESIKWTGFNEIGAAPDLSGYATHDEVNAVKTTAEAAKTATETNAAAIAAVKTTADKAAADVTTLKDQVSTNTGAIQKNANDITALQTSIGASTDFVAAFEAALK